MIILCNHIINEMKNGDLISIYDIIEKFLKPNELQKKKNGEVFTPLELIREKCSKVPEEFWRDKNVKVLDPCCGIGNYQVVLIEFFMKGLIEEIPDEKERLYWIKTKILYCTDICSLNVALCKKITGVENVYCVDFLSCSFLDEMKFDMVIGNPPYQVVSKNLKAVGGRGLWEKFVLQSLEILKENGYLCFVHPQGWRRPESKIGSFMKPHQFIYLQTNTNPFIGVGVTVDYYVLKKNNNGQYTKMPFIPHDLSFENIFTNVKNNFFIKRSFIYSSEKDYVNKTCSTKFKYPLIHATNKTGVRYMYSSRNDKGHFGIPKIIFGDSGINDVIIDLKGEYGMTEHAIAFKIKTYEEGLFFKKIFLSELFKKILKNCSWGNYQIEWRLFTYLKKDFNNCEES